MEESLAKRVGSAACAGWWTLLILVVYMVVAWIIWLGILLIRPHWLLVLWGGGISWNTVQMITLWFFAVVKLILLVALMLLVWLTIWSYRLKRAE